MDDSHPFIRWTSVAARFTNRSLRASCCRGLMEERTGVSAMRLGKNIQGGLLVFLYALAVLTACVPQANNLPFLSPTPTCTGGWGPYIGKDMPEWTQAWQAAFAETHLEAMDVKVQGVGETWVSICGGKRTESWGMAYAQIQATLLVDDVQDPELLGNTMEKVYRAVKTLTSNQPDLAKANLSILFVSRTDKNQVVRRNCNFVQGLEMMGQGTSGKKLFEATCTK